MANDITSCSPQYEFLKTLSICIIIDLPLTVFQQTSITGKQESLKILHPHTGFSRDFGIPTPIFLGKSASLQENRHPLA